MSVGGQTVEITAPRLSHFGENWFKEEPMEQQTQGRVLNLEMYRVRKRLEDCGLQWREDKSGKVRIWIRLRDGETLSEEKVEPKSKILELYPPD